MRVYSEICKYETSPTLHLSIEVHKEEFMQFVFDITDHFTRNANGHGTCHVSGGVQ